jgi:type VI secretion system protein ImpF
MAELAPRERLQPSLLDRLTDNEPDKTMESRERRVLSLRTLHQSVLRDLALLLNTTCFFRTKENTKPYPEVVSSVVNYGMPDIAGASIAGIKIEELESTIKEAITNFEPRLIKETVSVKAISRIQEGVHYNKIAFTIQADMWALPYPERLYLKTELDTEGRGFNLTEMDRPR